jgi:hypothetical protein
MKFDLQHYDLVRVIQTLYRHAKPAGIGMLRSHFEDIKQNLSRGYCENLLLNSTISIRSRKEICVDYIFGRPIKFEYDLNKKIIDSVKYDVRNGRQMFWTALVNEFGTDSVKIVRKRYPPFTNFLNVASTKQASLELKKTIRSIQWNSSLPKN